MEGLAGRSPLAMRLIEAVFAWGEGRMPTDKVSVSAMAKASECSLRNHPVPMVQYDDS